MTPEGRVKARVKDWLKAQHWWHYMPVQNGMGVVGIPDFICCAPLTITPDMVGATIGVFVAIETKAPGKRSNLSANQERRLDEIRQARGITYVIDDVSQLEQDHEQRAGAEAGRVPGGVQRPAREREEALGQQRRARQVREGARRPAE